MQVIVVGAGEVGFDVARMLSLEQHDVVVIDHDPKALQRVGDRLDVMTVEGTGTSAEVLVESGIQSADMIIAVTSLDEANLIACMIADRMGVGTTIARLRSYEFTRAQSVLRAADFGIDLILHPEESAADEVVRLIRRTEATDVLPFANGRLQLVGMRLDEDSPATGATLRELLEQHSGISFRVMGIARGERTVLPRGDERLHAGDQLFVLGHPSDLSAVARFFGKSETDVNNVMILGGSSVGMHVAEQLGQDMNKNVKLIEPDRERCQELAEKLPDVLVIQGDTTDIDLLATEGIGEMDAFVAVTDDQESNLVTCLMAKHLEVPKTVALLSKGAYVPISQTIGLDAAVSKKLAVSREVMRFLRGKHVRSVATVHGLDAEILVIEAKPDAPVTGGTLRELRLPEGLLLGAVLQNGDVEVATGTTHLQPGDRAIVFVRPGHVSEVERFFDTR